MQATVTRLNKHFGNCEAKTPTDILLVFSVPKPVLLRLDDVLEVDLSALDREQTVRNLTQETSIVATIKTMDVHDLRIECCHGTTRHPTPERLLEQPR